MPSPPAAPRPPPASRAAASVERSRTESSATLELHRGAGGLKAVQRTAAQAGSTQPGGTPPGSIQSAPRKSPKGPVTRSHRGHLEHTEHCANYSAFLIADPWQHSPITSHTPHSPTKHLTSAPWPQTCPPPQTHPVECWIVHSTIPQRGKRFPCPLSGHDKRRRSNSNSDAGNNPHTAGKL